MLIQIFNTKNNNTIPLRNEENLIVSATPYENVFTCGQIPENILKKMIGNSIPNKDIDVRKFILFASNLLGI